jgi:energy-coupling factor transporter ATP-binding protein EcfA2
MRRLEQSDLRLKSFSFEERQGDEIEFEVSKIDLGNFNLFIGNNAQGKTRIFKVFDFVKNLLTGQGRQISTSFNAKFNFEILSSKESVHYTLKVTPGTEGNSYVEEISRGDLQLLSTGTKKILLNEKTNQTVDNFFVPQNLPAISAINDKQFNTIKLIREFFLRMLFINSSKVNEVINDPASFSLNSLGTNLVSVLNNWSQKYPEIYEEVKEDFKRCFPFIMDVKFIKRPLLGRLGLIDLLAINEEGVSKEIEQLAWSDGMWRMLCLICLPKTQYEFDKHLYPPSLICIDEIENGLDFNTLQYITDYLRTYSENIQIIVSSHSPLMGKFIHPKDWQIVKRKGSKIRATKPSEIEQDLDEQLDLYKQEYWDFYEKHVSVSESYEPK